jgi:hypothetical protein
MHDAGLANADIIIVTITAASSMKYNNKQNS